MRFVRFSNNLKSLLAEDLPSDWRITSGTPKDKTVKIDFRNVAVADGTMTGYVDAFVYSEVADYAVLKTVYDFLASYSISGISKQDFGLRSVQMLSDPLDTLKAFKVSIDFSALMIPDAGPSGVAPDSLVSDLDVTLSNGYTSGAFADLEAAGGNTMLWQTSTGRYDVHFKWTAPVAEFTTIAMRIKTNQQLDVYFGTAFDDPGVQIAANVDWQDFSYTFDDPTTFNWTYLTTSGTADMSMNLWETGTSGAAEIEIDYILLS